MLVWAEGGGGEVFLHQKTIKNTQTSDDYVLTAKYTHDSVVTWRARANVATFRVGASCCLVAIVATVVRHKSFGNRLAVGRTAVASELCASNVNFGGNRAKLAIGRAVSKSSAHFGKQFQAGSLKRKTSVGL